LEVVERLIACRVQVRYFAVPEISFVRPGTKEIVLVDAGARDVRIRGIRRGIRSGARRNASIRERRSGLVYAGHIVVAGGRRRLLASTPTAPTAASPPRGPHAQVR